MLEAVAGVLADVAVDSGPVVVVIEDVHWADPSTADFLRFLLTRLRDQRLLVVATHRTEGLAARPRLRRLLAELARLPAVTRLDLRPFDAAEASEYLHELLGHPVDQTAATRLVERTGGNPYYLAALGTAGAASALPHGLSDVLLGRLDALSADARAVAGALSVAGRPVEHDTLLRVVSAQTVPQDARLDALGVDAAVRELVDDGLLVIDGDRHGLAHALSPRRSTPTCCLPSVPGCTRRTPPR